METIEYENFLEFHTEINGIVLANQISYFYFQNAINRIFDPYQILPNAESPEFGMLVKNGNEIEVAFLITDHSGYLFGPCQNLAAVDLISEEHMNAVQSTMTIVGKREFVEHLTTLDETEYVFSNPRKYFQYGAEAILQDQVGPGENRIATVNDEQFLQHLFWDFYQEEFDGQGQENQESVTASALPAIAQGRVHVLEIEGQIIGYLTYDYLVHGDLWIKAIYIRPEARQLGHAKTLLHSFVEQKLETIEGRSIGAMIKSSNLPSMTLFTSCGFNETYETIRAIRA